MSKTSDKQRTYQHLARRRSRAARRREDTYGRYSMVLDWDAVDHIYVVTVPDLPGCRTHGATVEEAARKGRQAIESWIDAARAWGRPIPAPRDALHDAAPLAGVG